MYSVILQSHNIILSLLCHFAKAGCLAYFLVEKFTGVRLTARSLRTDCRCSPVRWLLCDYLLILITETIFSRYMLPNLWMKMEHGHSLRNGVNCAIVTLQLRIFAGAVSMSMENGMRSSSKWLFCASKSPKCFLCSDCSWSCYGSVQGARLCALKQGRSSFSARCSSTIVVTQH